MTEQKLKQSEKEKELKPFSTEWEAELMKWSKKDIIRLYRGISLNLIEKVTFTKKL